MIRGRWREPRVRERHDSPGVLRRSPSRSVHTHDLRRMRRRSSRRRHRGSSRARRASAPFRARVPFARRTAGAEELAAVVDAPVAVTVEGEPRGPRRWPVAAVALAIGDEIEGAARVRAERDRRVVEGEHQRCRRRLTRPPGRSKRSFAPCSSPARAAGRVDVPRRVVERARLRRIFHARRRSRSRTSARTSRSRRSLPMTSTINVAHVHAEDSLADRALARRRSPVVPALGRERLRGHAAAPG